MLQLIDMENEDSEDTLKKNVNKLEVEQPTIKRKEEKLVTNKILSKETEQISKGEPLSKKLEDEDDEKKFIRKIWKYSSCKNTCKCNENFRYSKII